MNKEEREPGERQVEDLFISTWPPILTPLGSRIQNLVQQQAEFSGGELQMRPSLGRHEEEEKERQELAKELGYLRDGKFNIEALRMDWERLSQPKRLKFKI